MSTTGDTLQFVPGQMCCPPCEGRAIAVTIRRAADVSADKVDAELASLSQGGVKLSVSTHLAVQEAVVLSFEIPELDLQVSRSARVSWIDPVSPENWRIGCSFEQLLPGEVIDELAIHGYLQRRKDPRRSISLEGRVRWQMAYKSVPIWIMNYSAGGVCIFSPQTGKVGESLVIELDDGTGAPALVFARAQWQKEVQGGYFIGCMFLNVDGHRLLESLLEKSNSTGPGSTHLGQRQAGSRLVVLITLLLICLMTFVILR